MLEKIQFYLDRFLTEIIMIFVLSSMLFYYGIVLLWPQFNSENSSKISISKGSTLIDVSNQLFDQRIIKNKKSFILAVKTLGYEKDLPAGKFLIEEATTNYCIIKKIVNSVALSKKMTILEGWSVNDIALELESKFNIKKDSFLKAVKSPRLLRNWKIDGNSFEGYLFPDTYLLPEDASPEDVINKMVSEYNNNISAVMRKRMAEINLSENEVLTLASIIEGEAIFDSERPRISGVYHNRLKKRMRLQADPTIQYIIEDSPRRLLNKDLKIKSPYNTYLNYGLPPGPINNPGIESIKAALYPEDVDFLFFVARGDGYHTFTRTEKEHNKAKKEFQKIRRKNKKSKKANNT